MVWAEGRECDVCARVRLGGSTASVGIDAAVSSLQSIPYEVTEGNWSFNHVRF